MDIDKPKCQEQPAMETSAICIHTSGIKPVHLHSNVARSQYFGHAYFHARSPQYAVHTAYNYNRSV